MMTNIQRILTLSFLLFIGAPAAFAESENLSAYPASSLPAPIDARVFSPMQSSSGKTTTHRRHLHVAHRQHHHKLNN